MQNLSSRDNFGGCPRKKCALDVLFAKNAAQKRVRD